MYFPYLRGRQYELLAVRELFLSGLIGKSIIPIIEPVKLSSTLLGLLRTAVQQEKQIGLIVNPEVGSFVDEITQTQEGSKEEKLGLEIKQLLDSQTINKTVLIKRESKAVIDSLSKMSNTNLMYIVNDRDYLDEYDCSIKNIKPRFVLIPDESVFRRRIHENRILLDDKFNKRERNSDYMEKPDEFFSDDHLYYRGDGFEGFSDYSIIGDDYSESGFAPLAVAIHIVYFASDKSLRVMHFVSDSNDDIQNPAKKFYEAVSKLNFWYEKNKNKVHLTQGLKDFLEHFKNKTYPGLGTVKKLSIMHHLELMEEYLNSEN